MLYRMEGEGKAVSDKIYSSDASEVSEWAKGSFGWAISAGMINGVSDTELSPASDATRAQVATMLWRFTGQEY